LLAIMARRRRDCLRRSAKKRNDRQSADQGR
jgi:hypothetical protein